METHIKENWIKALRSGEYSKAIGAYCDVGQGENCYCALGLLMVSNKIEWRDALSVLPELGIPIEGNLGIFDVIISMNDYENKSFEEIADWIEQNL